AGVEGKRGWGLEIPKSKSKTAKLQTGTAVYWGVQDLLDGKFNRQGGSQVNVVGFAMKDAVLSENRSALSVEVSDPSSALGGGYLEAKLPQLNGAACVRIVRGSVVVLEKVNFGPEEQKSNTLRGYGGPQRLYFTLRVIERTSRGDWGPATSLVGDQKLVDYVEELTSWWRMEEMNMKKHARGRDEGVKRGRVGKIPLGLKEKRIEGMEEGVFCDVRAEVVQFRAGKEGQYHVVLVTDYTSNDKLELYDRVGKKAWDGPWGRRTLEVKCWGRNAEALKGVGRKGNFLKLANLRVKQDERNGYLMAHMNEDRERGEQINVKLEVGDKWIQEINVAKSTYLDAKKGNGIGWQLGSSDTIEKVEVELVRVKEEGELEGGPSVCLSGRNCPMDRLSDLWRDELETGGGVDKVRQIRGYIVGMRPENKEDWVIRWCPNCQSRIRQQAEMCDHCVPGKGSVALGYDFELSIAESVPCGEQDIEEELGFAYTPWIGVNTMGGLNVMDDMFPGLESPVQLPDGRFNVSGVADRMDALKKGAKSWMWRMQRKGSQKILTEERDEAKFGGKWVAFDASFRR
ncbi:hypothetical protein P7C70_g9029, partial [Phenoliferia sp. Uapishka_3]